MEKCASKEKYLPFKLESQDWSVIWHFFLLYLEKSSFVCAQEFVKWNQAYFKYHLIVAEDRIFQMLQKNVIFINLPFWNYISSRKLLFAKCICLLATLARHEKSLFRNALDSFIPKCPKSVHRCQRCRKQYLQPRHSFSRRSREAEDLAVRHHARCDGADGHTMGELWGENSIKVRSQRMAWAQSTVVKHYQ